MVGGCFGHPMDNWDGSPPSGRPNGVAESPPRPNEGGQSLPNGPWGGFGQPPIFFFLKKKMFF